MSALAQILSVIASYMIGAIPFGLLFAKLFPASM
jgi:glycerol-3-phosphate acyltransferase PlsY